MMAKKTVKNYVTFVVDRSGSMSPFTDDIPRVLGDLVQKIKSNGKLLGQQTRVAFQYFNTNVDEAPGFTLVDDGVDIPSYWPNGMTALNDAIISAVKNHKRRVKPNLLNSDVAHLIIVLTDGEENGSRHTHSEVRQTIESLEDCTVVMNVPKGTDRHYLANVYGLDIENVNVWEVSERGLGETKAKTSVALDSYQLARSQGVKKVTNFYATTDLSHLNKADLQDCENMTKLFKVVEVPREMRIDEFVKSTTGRPYVRGTNFYQLSKKEKVQAHKDLIVKEKTNPTLYGGSKIRDVLNIPRYIDGELTPGNHANYDIFVQSTSDNRKLVRGTKVLVMK